ncbi:hypothetical protein [Hominibacterium faecale]|uniref:hypothetical protein n=1 Tax=Hominibacterium faecale TaxID=2839743 RepID=UPI0022B2A40B|nr:hypothetical protein [Hominibacterium faecale]
MILNYTTTIDAYKTVSEIEYILVKHKAKSVLKNYTNDGSIESLSFIVEIPTGQMPIKLPVNTDAALAVLIREKKSNPRKQIKTTREQAERVAWRILKDWVEAQMALIEIELVKMEQVFLPYAVLDESGETIFEKLESRQFLLPE